MNMLIEECFSFTGNRAIKQHNKTNSKQGKLEVGEGGLVSVGAYTRMYFRNYK